VAVSDIAQRLAAVQARVARACARAGREAHDVRLIAVSKKHSVEAMRAAYAAGQRDFGENYVQELTHKARLLAELPDLRLHFIGRLQRNKVKDVLRARAVIGTLDSIALAQAVAERAEQVGARAEVLVQVNVGDEPQKAGVAPSALAELVAAVGGLSSVSLLGLFAIPPAGDDPQAARPYFRLLRELAQQHGLRELSMGMSDDFEIAIEEGATSVRVGTAIFGPRGA
jgi:PLP dependent protein